MKNMGGGLNQFSTESKPDTFLTFSGEEKKTCPFILFNKATRELNKTTGN